MRLFAPPLCHFIPFLFHSTSVVGLLHSYKHKLLHINSLFFELSILMKQIDTFFYKHA